MPSAKSVPAGCVVAASPSSASRASSVSPTRAAASTSSNSAHIVRPGKDAVRDDFAGRRCGLLVASEAVVQHRGGPVRDHHRVALPSCGAVLDDRLDQGQASASRPCKAEDPEQRERRDLVPRRRRDALGLGDQPSRARQVASPRPVQRQRLEVDRQLCRARPPRGRAGPVARTPRSLRRPTSPTSRRQPATPHRRTSSTGSCRTSSAARWRIGMAAACPSVISSGKAFDHQVERMRVRWQRWERADSAADLEQDVRSAEMVRSDGGAPRGQVGPASEADVERLELSRSFEEQRRRLVAVARRRRQRGLAGARLARAGSRRAGRFLPWPGAAAPIRNRRPGSSPPPRPARALPGGPGPGSEPSPARGTPQRPRDRRDPALALRSVRGRRPRPRQVRQPQGRGARRGGRPRARDRSPPRARRARAVVRRATRLGTPLSAPAGGGTEPGRRFRAARLPSREPARQGRCKSRSAARHSSAASPSGSAAASSMSRCVASGNPATRRRYRSSSRLGRSPAAGGAKPPARSDGLIRCDSSTSASGLPPVSAMIRSRTRSSSRPGTALDSRARASAHRGLRATAAAGRRARAL